MNVRPLFLCMTALTLALAAGCNRRVAVTAATPERGEIVESFTEPARTRLAKTYRISTPVAGRIGRVNLEPGDPVTKGQVLVAYDLVPLREAAVEAEAAVKQLEADIAVQDDNRLEDTVLIEAKQTVEAAEIALKAADEQVAAETIRADHAQRTLARTRKAEGTYTEAQVDQAQTAADTALIQLREQQFTRAALKAMIVAVKLGPGFVTKYIQRKTLERVGLVEQLAQARARLARARHDLKLAGITSPIDGVVLQKYDQGDTAVSAGQPLLLLGNLAELEVEADVLTQDALRIREGTAVALEPAAGLAPLAGTVKRVEPAGFTKLSSLGVEQQRVWVIVGFDAQPERLGVGYRLQARFFTGRKGDALTVPRFSVMQNPDRSFYVFKIVAGTLKKQPVTIGLRSDLKLEVTDGLTDKDTLVSRPDATMQDGMTARVKE